MDSKQRVFLGDINFSLIMKTTDQLLGLINLLQTEVDYRNKIDSKEKAIDLAKKVEAETGKDQEVSVMEEDLLNMRKEYAQWTTAEPLARGEDRLQPISESQPQEDIVDMIDGEHVTRIGRYQYQKLDGTIIDYTPSTQVRMVKTDLTQPDGTPRWRVEQKVGEDQWKVLGVQ